MSFKEGFETIEKVKASALKLSEAVARIEALEGQLAELREAQAGVEAMLDKARTAIDELEESAKGLSEQREEFAKVAQTLPIIAENVLVAAESRLEKQMAEIARLAQRLPEMVELVVEQKLTAIVAQMESRLTERLRDELKDTRTTLREAFETNTNRSEAKLEEFRKDIIAEMPRSLFGRRGR